MVIKINSKLQTVNTAAYSAFIVEASERENAVTLIQTSPKVPELAMGKVLEGKKMFPQTPPLLFLFLQAAGFMTVGKFYPARIIHHLDHYNIITFRKFLPRGKRR